MSSADTAAFSDRSGGRDRCAQAVTCPLSSLHEALARRRTRHVSTFGIGVPRLAASDRPPGARMSVVSIKEVARRAGVSLGTVSNVLNRPALVGSETRARVLEPSTSSATCATSRPGNCAPGSSRTLAYVVLDASNPFFTDVARGVEAGRGGGRHGPVSSATAARTRRGAPLSRPAGTAAGARRAHHAGRRPTPPPDQASRRGIPLVLVDRVADAGTLFGLGRRRPRRRGWPRPTWSSVAIARSPSSADRTPSRRSAIAGPGRIARWSRPGSRNRACSLTDTTAMTVADGRRAGREVLAVPARAARPPSSAPTTCWRSACCRR